MWAYNFLRTKYFHEVSPASLHAYSLKSRYGIVRTSLTISLTPAERRTLRTWQRARTLPAGLARRARIILLLADGLPITAIATMVGMSRPQVYKWIHRFRQEGLAGLHAKPGPGHRLGPQPPAMRDQRNNLEVG
jgi:biotin operon repressor